MVRRGELSADEEELLWQFALDFHDRLVVKNEVGDEHMASLLLARLNPAIFVSAVEKFADIPELAGPLGYFAGVRMQLLNRPDLAEQCFEAAAKYAPAESKLRELIESEREKVGPEAAPPE